LKDSQAARNAWFGISRFKPLSPFSLMKYYTMLGSLWEPTNDEPKKRGPTLSDEERKFRKI